MLDPAPVVISLSFPLIATILSVTTQRQRVDKAADLGDSVAVEHLHLRLEGLEVAVTIEKADR
jgi:hypothetical protein